MIKSVATWLLLCCLAGLLCACQGRHPSFVARTSSPFGSDGPNGVLIAHVEDPVARRKATIFLNLAQAYFEQGLWSVTLEKVNLAIQTDPRWVPSFNLQALAYQASGNFEMAQRSFENGLLAASRYPALGSELADLHHNMALMLCQRGDFDRAQIEFNKALIQPGYALVAKTNQAKQLCLRR